jgi:hypothetical protein
MVLGLKFNCWSAAMICPSVAPKNPFTVRTVE